MRGLAFPPVDQSARELSDPNATPVIPDNIPIDPALFATPVDPTLLQPHTSPQASPTYPPPPPFSHPPPPPDQWSHEKLPDGDPFAPQNTLPYLPIIEVPTPPPPNHKPFRKRPKRFHRDEECSFCQGNDTRNKAGQPELMVTCHECGRAGHPSCMELSKIGDMLRSYPWKCIECKNCEVCLEKGDDERILFCDGCDRGWHFDCMNPPINELPEGEWHCPPCQEAAAQRFYSPTSLPPQPQPDMLTNDPNAHYIPPPDAYSFREPSVASSSHSVTLTSASRARSIGRPRNRGKRQKAEGIVESDGNEDAELNVDGEDGASTQTPATKAKPPDRRSRSIKRVRPKPVEMDGTEEHVLEDRDSTPVQSRSRKRKRDLDSSPVAIPRVRLRLPTTRNTNGKGKEKEEQEEIVGLFEGILSIEDRDVSKTTITTYDKQLFERSRQESDKKLIPPPTSAISTNASNSFSRASMSISDSYFDSSLAGPSRPLRSASLQQTQTQMLPTPSPVPSTPGGPNALYSVTTRGDPDALRIKTIRFGPYDIKTWYDAPFPEEYASIPDGRMWICEFCLKYMKSRFQAMRHRLKCKVRNPPGDEIYRDGSVSIFEVDGRKNKIYCQNLCLLSKMFLDHKSLFYDVEPFLFYVITEVDDLGARFVGYFSKEKRSPKDYNLSCIMTLPVRQRQGWGNLLIDFSYLLSKVEQRIGSPEKPLSSLGALGYRKYWTLAVMRYLETAPDHPRLEEISSATSMTLEDVYETLVQQSMIFTREATPPPIKPIPGQAIRIPKNRKTGFSGSIRRSKSSNQLHRAQSRYKSQDPSTPGDGSLPFLIPKHYEIRFDRDKVKGYLKNWEAKGYLTLKPEKLQWTPYLLTRHGIEESKANGKEPNGTTPLKVNGSSIIDHSEVATMMNGSHSEAATTPPGSKPSMSPTSSGMSIRTIHTQERDDDDDGELPIVLHTRRNKRMSQTPRSSRARVNGRGQEYHTPTPVNKSEDPRSVRRRNRLAREDEVLNKKLVLEEELPLTPRAGAGRKRRRVESESPPKGCATVATDQTGSPAGEKVEEEGCAGADVKYEDTGTPLTQLTSPEETAFAMQKGPGIPVSDERSTIDMEMGDEDAEGSEEEPEDVECGI